MEQNSEARVPLGVVLISVGLILLLATTAVWLLMPQLMPRPLYQLVSPYLPAAETAVLLPETPLGTNSSSDTLPPAPVADPAYAPTRLIIPRIHIDATVQPVGLLPIVQDGQAYYQWQVPAGSAVGWHNETAVLGQPGNTVFNGHHNVHGEIFRDLADLDEGDEIIVENKETSYRYRVSTRLILKERGQSLATRTANASWIKPTDDERITLISCWPYTDNSHRVVVVAYPITDPQS